MDRRSMLGGCVAAVLGGIGFRGAAAGQFSEPSEVTDATERRFSIAGLSSSTVFTRDGKTLTLWSFGLHAHPLGSKRGTGTLADWLRMVPVDKVKCVVFTDKQHDGDRWAFVGLDDHATSEWVDLPVKADRWLWDNPQRDKMLLGMGPDGKLQWMEAYHLRADEQIEDVLDMDILPPLPPSLKPESYAEAKEAFTRLNT